MDLTLPKDILLLRNCMILQLRSLNLIPNKLDSETSLEIEKYKEIVELLNNHEIKDIDEKLNNLNDKNFSNISKISPSVLAINTLENFKKQLKDLQLYSEDEFEQIKAVFYQGNEDLRESENMNYMDCLKQLENLIRKNNPRKMTSLQFIEFSEKFKSLSKNFGINKFQEYFSNQNKKIVDMEIANDINENGNFLYRTTFSLIDFNQYLSKFIIEEPAPSSIVIANYYQNLCYSYLKADKCSKMDETKITNSQICENMNIFSECFQKLKDMSNYKINIFGKNMIRFSGESSIQPEDLSEDDRLI